MRLCLLKSLGVENLSVDSFLKLIRSVFGLRQIRVKSLVLNSFFNYLVYVHFTITDHIYLCFQLYFFRDCWEYCSRLKDLLRVLSEKNLWISRSLRVFINLIYRFIFRIQLVFVNFLRSILSRWCVTRFVLMLILLIYSKFTLIFKNFEILFVDINIHIVHHDPFQELYLIVSFLVIKLILNVTLTGGPLFNFNYFGPRSIHIILWLYFLLP